MVINRPDEARHWQLLLNRPETRPELYTPHTLREPTGACQNCHTWEMPRRRTGDNIEAGTRAWQPTEGDAACRRDQLDALPV